MTIREDLNKRRSLSTAKRCKLGALLDQLSRIDPDEFDALSDAIDLVRHARETNSIDLFTIQWLHDVLVSNGCSIGKTVVSDHVREVCACDYR